MKEENVRVAFIRSEQRLFVFFGESLPPATKLPLNTVLRFPPSCQQDCSNMFLTVKRCKIHAKLFHHFLFACLTDISALSLFLL